jgi:hypothetical protein
MTVQVTDLAKLRKAAAFVDKLNAIEAEFGYTLTIADSVPFAEGYAVSRGADRQVEEEREPATNLGWARIPATVVTITRPGPLTLTLTSRNGAPL